MSTINNDEQFAALFKESIASDYKNALLLMNVSPDVSLFKFRKILETLCLLYAQHHSYEFTNKNLWEQINELADISAIHGADRELFHAVRELTNDGVHNKELGNEILLSKALVSRKKVLDLLESAYLSLGLGERLPQYELIDVGGQEHKDLWFNCLISRDYKEYLSLGDFYEKMGKVFESEDLDEKSFTARAQTMYSFAAESYKSAFQLCSKKTITDVISTDDKQISIAQQSHQILFKYALLCLNNKVDNLHITEVTILLNALAKRGFYAAYAYLGWCHYLSEDYKKAHKYLTHKRAEHTVFLYQRLGVLYSSGKASLINGDKAVESFKKAVGLGCNKSMFELGKIYYKGELVKKDDELAQNYLCQAIATGNLDAVLYLDEKYLKIRELFSGLLEEIKGDKVKVEPQKPCIKTTKLGRNEPCSCGSNLKYKNCCGK
ncbi:DUF4145 domain-containing protein [Pseudoalteromonas sp. APC 3358]|uniref:DUF4145 domain-containing protein n=1 Tax=Pseudoalteromonas sp. APC 3358 TaxID=3035176 RepID=UPI0025B4C98A|nr:DUF4145 domain-containing protein [Pseudoalteromonas sp. APC 3358]MDN3381565.1 DUF4145 domain-containing protein [Pseudoalteromonas sp. APC 3358]